MASVELHLSHDRERVALLLTVRDYLSGDGDNVSAFRDPLELVYARRVGGSHRHWRIGGRAPGARDLLDQLVRRLSRKGVARLSAGVFAPSGGKLSDFRIKRLDRPAPALGPIPHG